MADSILYSGVDIIFDDKPMAEAASVTIRKNPALNPVFTLAKGFAGMSLGAATCEMTIDSAVPAADFEVNPDPYMQKGRIVEVGLVMANRQMQGKMFVTGGDYSRAVNQEARLTITLMGPMAPWE